MSTAANSPGYFLKLHSRREVADRTMAFEFDKPAGFGFKAGQFVEIAWSIQRRPTQREMRAHSRLRALLMKNTWCSLPDCGIRLSSACYRRRRLEPSRGWKDPLAI